MKERQEELQALSSIISKNGVDKFDGSLTSLFNIVLEQTNSKDIPGTRKSEIVFARQLAHAIAYVLKAKRFYPYTLEEIGWEIGQKDHAVVIYSHKTISKHLNTGYMTDIILSCVSLFGLDGEDMLVDGYIGKQVMINAYYKGKLVEKFRSKKQAAEYYKCSVARICEILNEHRSRSVINNRTLKIECVN